MTLGSCTHRPQSEPNAVSVLYAHQQSAVILNVVKDLHLLFRHSSGPMLCGNQQVHSRTNRDSDPSTRGWSIRSAQVSLRVSSPSVPSPKYRVRLRLAMM